MASASQPRSATAVPVAWIQPQPGAPTPQGDMLLTHLAQHLAAYKLPTHLLVAAERPRNSTGKFDRRQLRDQAITRLATAPTDASAGCRG